MQQLAQLGAKFEENVLDAMNAWSRRVTDPAELAGINPVIVEQARARAAGRAWKAGCSCSSSPPTSR
jgi:oligopeptidase A